MEIGPSKLKGFPLFASVCAKPFVRAGLQTARPLVAKVDHTRRTLREVDTQVDPYNEIYVISKLAGSSQLDIIIAGEHHV